MNNKVSVVIPTYNGKDKLVISLDSILRQTYKNIEIIIVDDGSSDDTDKMISEVNDSRIKYFYKKNSGVSDTRNFGLKKATGDYIFFLDNDDYVDDDYIDVMFKQSVSDNAEICYCGYKTFNLSSNRRKIKRTLFTKKNILYNYFIDKLRLQTGCFFIKRDFLIDSKIIFRTNVSWGEDYEFFSKLLKNANSITYVKKYMLNYNISDNAEKLSKLSLDKIEKDNAMIDVLTEEMCLSKKERSALINYRQPALIINKLFMLSKKIDKTILKKIYFDNKKYISNLKPLVFLKFIKLKLLLLYLKGHLYE